MMFGKFFQENNNFDGKKLTIKASLTCHLLSCEYPTGPIHPQWEYQSVVGKNKIYVAVWNIQGCGFVTANNIWTRNKHISNSNICVWKEIILIRFLQLQFRKTWLKHKKLNEQIWLIGNTHAVLASTQNHQRGGTNCKTECGSVWFCIVRTYRHIWLKPNGSEPQ